MIKTCKQCKESKPLIMFAKARNAYNIMKYLTVCKACKSYNTRMTRQKQKFKNINSQYDPLEQSKNAFEDDPRALKEVEYGKVTRNTTSLFSRSILDEFG
jgi:protein-arginine kinase activator protein McsA